MGETRPIDHRQADRSKDAVLHLRRWTLAGIVYPALVLCQLPDAAEAVPLAYVANAGSGHVSVINTATNVVVALTPVGLAPEQIAITPNGLFAYFSNSGSNTVSVIATFNNTVTATVPVGTGPAGVAVTPSDISIIPTLSDGTLVFLVAAMAAALALRIVTMQVSRLRRPPRAI
ncbi:MAG: YncE family protein [candidate division NC10 bacterium]|nr:YncE family protein [candidate division NC10 bacterium]